MRISEDVLRYLTVRVEALEEGPSAVMQNRGREDERGPRGDRDRGDRDRGERRPRFEREPRDAAPMPSTPVDAEGGPA
jgi:small subunit ribosomal protein S6